MKLFDNLKKIGKDYLSNNKSRLIDKGLQLAKGHVRNKYAQKTMGTGEMLQQNSHQVSNMNRHLEKITPNNIENLVSTGIEGFNMFKKLLS